MEILIDHEVHGYNGFKSNFTRDTFQEEASVYTWDAFEIIFHYPSEHLVNEQRMDIEWQVYHFANSDELAINLGQEVTSEEDQASTSSGHRRLAEDGGHEDHFEFLPVERPIIFDFAVVSLLFDSENYDRNISQEEIDFLDSFFESLDLDNDNVYLDLVEIGKLMELMDFSRRWAYRGSVSYPPCHRLVYWNVIEKVYPIKAKHVDQFRAKLERWGLDFSTSIGNVREVQRRFNKDVYFIMSGAVRLGGVWAVLAGGVLAVWA
uniref:carbonic anhydrase n=1 Tax=Strombidium rassoulzadegani TaxID=1082188 RepID=A0A7S3CUA8_9SPIT|mmetsp:Transcript_9556/g.16043  ORF Transcript_9556/g.16043 Transcript_9556/m.16043 type:complete len:263 (+) Transcript_9556:1665-2453(+)